VSDDIVIGQVTTALLAAPAILVAHELDLFSALEDGADLADVCSRLSLRERAAEALLLNAVAAGLAERRGDRYALSDAGAEYLLRSSPKSWCAYLDYLIAHPRLFSYEGVRDALVADRPEAAADLFETHRHDDAQALQFTRWMHSVSVGPAGAWPDAIDLSEVGRLLDIAGGSGAHAIGAARRWPQLEAVVLDLPNVCAMADEYLQDANLDGRARTQAVDMWRDPYPDADAHFYSQVFHDWSPVECRTLAAKSLAALPSGGRIIVHELLYDDDKRGPQRAASVNLMMSMLYARGRQYSGAELATLLGDVGFVDVRWQRTYGYWGVVVGRKPRVASPTSREERTAT
jgi:hypothetical protein